MRGGPQCQRLTRHRSRHRRDDGTGPIPFVARGYTPRYSLSSPSGAARAEADPRPGIAPGHIPGSRNLPYAALYRDDGTFKSEAGLRAEFEAAGVDPAAPFIASCGSGVTANSLIFAARRLGGRGQKLYDGSWSDYGADPATPKENGPAR